MSSPVNRSADPTPVPALRRAICFRCYFYIGAPNLAARGACCPRCRFPLIVTTGPLEVTQDEVERMFERLRRAQARTAYLHRLQARMSPNQAPGSAPAAAPRARAAAGGR